ncbi:MAG TPA: rod shape-determining protein MreC [Patescibacteria group bacterium]|nr:rod shape-determining protein MreC [Patescibacteria group bacterium]
MVRRGSIVPVFFFFIVLASISYGLSQTSVGGQTVGIVELLLAPLQHNLFSAVAADRNDNSPVQKLQQENSQLRTQLAHYQQQDKEIQALRDQFNTQSPPPSTLLPAQVVGLRSFIPGVSLPEQLIIDKGLKEGLRVGSIIVYKNELVGRVSRSTDHLSLVDLSYKKGFSMTAETSSSHALGISKGQGQGAILFDNVVLSETLAGGDVVVTKGSQELDGTGAPPGLVIGKIISIDKKASNLFQTAKVQPLFDSRTLTTVFVLPVTK